MTVSTFMRSKIRASGATVALLIVGMVLAACTLQPLAEQPAPEMGDAPQTETYTDENGFFTAEYPAGWVVAPYYPPDDDPSPSVTLATDREIFELYEMDEPLPEDQIGMGVYLYHRDMLAEAGVTAETPLQELAQITMMLTAPDHAETAEATYESTTLENGTPAVRITMAAPPNVAYVVQMADMGDGVILLAPQILALDYENAELEAQVEAIISSVEVIASGEEFITFIMEHMGATEE